MTSLRTLVFADLKRYDGRRPSWLRVLAASAVNPGLAATVVYRLQQAAYARGARRTARMLRTVNLMLFGVDLLPDVVFGGGLYMPHPSGIVIGAARFGDNVTVLQGVTVGATTHADQLHRMGRVEVEDGAVLSAQAFVLEGVRVGAGAEIGAHSVVLADVPAGAVMVGAPARQVGTRTSGDHR